ncbi:MAG TPA: rhomboid family intramembrane serine protease [Thermoleophilia bacterium]|nr:rhomboid family intramembrane serine protease [Thermoleophilia bacterium]
MITTDDDTPERQFPIVNATLIGLNFAVFLFYELPDLQAAILHASFYPATLTGWHGPLPWYVSWLTAMFLHASWSHILGNMLFLWVFGDSVEQAFGRARYLALYLAGGFAAMLLQAGMTLLFSSPAAAHVPCLGASGAIAAVLGAYFILCPREPLVLFPVPLVVPAWIFLGLWFLYQFVMANLGLLTPGNNGVAFFAHVGGFVFGLVVTKALVDSGHLSRSGGGTRWNEA